MPTPPIPQPLRAAAGLAAVAIDSARKLPEQLVGFPVLAVSAALQASLKAQQRYAELVVRGDQLLDQLRGPGDGTPTWARFDDDVPSGPPPARSRSAFDLAGPLAEDDHEVADLLARGEADAEALAEAEAATQPPTEALAEAAALAEAVIELAETETLAEAETEALAAEPAGAADLAAAVEAVELVEAAAPAEAVTGLAEAETAALAEAVTADGYLSTEPPVPGYDTLSIPQLRGRLRSLSVEQVEALAAYERGARARPPFLTMLENRVATLRSR
ncbi:MAG TPA: lipid droplet-associated protein [Mycobacteriales bacterium]